jgi:hypothetical protein
MRVLSRLVLIGSLSLWGCGGGTATKATGMIGGDGAATEADGGPIGRRGGGNGSFGDDDSGTPPGDPGDGPTPSGDDAAPTADVAVVVVDARPRDAITPGPDVVLSSDSDPAPSDLAVAPDSGNICDDGTCSALRQQYQDALVRATTCITTLKGQCTQKAPANLDCPCSQVWVNSTVETDKAAANYRAAGCDKCRHVCTLLCRVLSTGVCSPSKLALVQDPGTNIVAPPPDRGTCTDSGGPMP